MKATKDFKKINILINGEESNRDEIIYNNLISNLNLTEEEQVKYLKRRAMTLEQEIKNQKLTLKNTNYYENRNKKIPFNNNN